MSYYIVLRGFLKKNDTFKMMFFQLCLTSSCLYIAFLEKHEQFIHSAFNFSKTSLSYAMHRLRHIDVFQCPKSSLENFPGPYVSNLSLISLHPHSIPILGSMGCV